MEDRTFEFARRVRAFVRKVPKDIPNIEANEALSKKDFLMRAKIARKEAKESHYWLRLICAGDDGWCKGEQEALIREAKELTSIFGAIVTKSQ